MNENKSKIQTFEDLKVWQIARDIKNDIFEVSKKLPKVERYSLTDQMVRASRSISNNISEGYGRFHHQENIQFCRIARGSAYELLNHLITANDCSYITDAEVDYHKSRITRCIKLINGYIRYLKRAKNNSKAEEKQVSYQNSDTDHEPRLHE
jgi:four helix bundle protein